MSEAFARRYKLLDRIAIGGTAEVFRALFLAGDEERPVVIKRVLPQFARDERFRRLFHEEACVAVTMRHPSIVRVLDHGDLGPTCYIALELVEGKDLGSLLAATERAGRRVPAALAAFVAAQVADALQFIHGQTSSEGTPLRIIHRDVSPQNILVSYTGDVKLTDFGIAKSAIRRDQTVDGTLRGKLDYMSPEQASLGEVDQRADIFALGCVLYEMLSGAPPFRAENELETLERVRQARMVRAPEALDAPPALRAVLDRALAARPADRYQRAGEMATDLRAFLGRESSPPAAQTVGAWARELTTAPAPVAQSRVDDAVRRLLGDDAEDPAPPARGTTVFATPGRGGAGLELAPLREESPAHRPRRPLNALLLGLALLGVCGWLLWALSALRRADPPAAGGALAAAPDARRAFVARRSADLGPATADGAPATKPEILVRSTPLGATVLVGGEARGKTPLAIPRPARPLLLELAKEGHRPWRRRIGPDAPSLLSAALLPLTGGPATTTRAYLTINSLPWSRVRVDGRFVGNTPLVKHVVRAGSRRVELVAPDGSVRKSLVVALEAGQGRSFTFDFTQ